MYNQSFLPRKEFIVYVTVCVKYEMQRHFQPFFNFRGDINTRTSKVSLGHQAFCLNKVWEK